MRFARVGLMLALFASPALAQAPPDPGCEFRAGTIAALFAANADTRSGARLVGAGDAAAAQPALAAAAARLRDERRRAGSEGRGIVDARERKTLRRALATAGRRTAKAAARARRGKIDRASAHAAAAMDEIARLLAEQVAAHATLACVGGEIRVAELAVGAGETLPVPSGATIVAERGVAILGDVVTDGALTIEAESGDVVLEGRVDASGGAAPRGARAARGGGAVEDCADAGDVTIRARRGNVRIGATFVAASDLGHDCPLLVVTDRSQLTEVVPQASVLRLAGRDGGAGGNIRVSAPTGAIVFATRPLDDPGVFWPGEGGAGQSLVVEGEFAPPAGFASVRIVAGSGGTSGSLTLDARTADVLPLYRVLAGGDGGRGGNVEWDVRLGEATFPSGLTSVYAVAGSGGDGAVAGGRGGDARYEGDRIVNAAGDPTTEVVAAGAAGGRIFEDVPRMPGDEIRGGDGGSAAATGHRGADGTDAHPEAGAGGAAEADGGPGRLAYDDPARSTGGDGGDASAIGGRGGRGLPSCVAPPGAGGPGGAGGLAVARAGDGGDGRVQGGTGGDSLGAVTGQPGEGGAGNPAGACGAVSPAPASVAGVGGAGETPGADGARAPAETTPCTSDTYTCDEVGPPRNPCVSPRYYGAFVSDFSSLADGRIYTIRETTLSGTEICDAVACISHHSGTYTTRSKFYDQPETTYTTAIEEDSGSLVFGVHRDLLWYDHCTSDGELHRAGGTGTDEWGGSGQVFRVTHTCTGACACGSTAVRCCPDGTGWVPSDDPLCR